MSPPAPATPFGAAISRRARVAVAGRLKAEGRVTLDDRPALDAPTHEEPALDTGLLESLRHHLLAGETHYPERPGMSDLRERIGAHLPAIGYASRDAAGVLVTASEGESLLVTLLGLGMVPGGCLVAQRGGRHERLLDWLGVDFGPEARSDSVAGTAYYREVESPSDPGSAASEDTLQEASEERPEEATDERSAPMIDATGGLLFSGFSPLPPHTPAEPSHTIVIGDLSGLRGVGPLHLGFVAADPQVLPQITKWKQASSICSPAPSQRAALWALGVRP